MDLQFIENYLEKEYRDDEININLKFIYNAINDWPIPIYNTNDYSSAVIEFIRMDVTKNNLEQFLSQVDYTKYAWHAESLSHIVEIFDFYSDGINFNEILVTLEVRIKTNLNIE